MYHFDEKVAVEVGVNAAIVLENFKFWINKNIANNKHYYDGEYWTYNSIKAFEILFPFWSSKQIRTILNKLIDNGYLNTGNYNKSPYDRTLWYSFTSKSKELLQLDNYTNKESAETEEGNSILPNGQINSTEKENENDQKGEPIPYKKTNEKPTTKTTTDEGNSSNEFKNLKLYNELGFGTINPTTASNILSLEEEYSEKWVELALKEADYNGSRKLSYVEGILKKWKISGVKSKIDKPKGEENKQQELTLEEQILEKVSDFDKNNKPIGIIKAIIYNWINLYSIDSINAAIEQCKSEDNKTMKRVKEILEG